jgi:hypothetical protein
MTLSPFATLTLPLKRSGRDAGNLRYFFGPERLRVGLRFASLFFDALVFYSEVPISFADDFPLFGKEGKGRFSQ